MTRSLTRIVRAFAAEYGTRSLLGEVIAVPTLVVALALVLTGMAVIL